MREYVKLSITFYKEKAGRRKKTESKRTAENNKKTEKDTDLY
mgnify:CR=1 FL=1